MRNTRWFVVSPVLAVGVVTLLAGQPGAGGKTENAVVVLVDGLRWQEVFRGAEDDLMTKDGGNVAHPEALKAQYWRDTPQARREVLLPFLWNVVARQGQVFGNQDRGCCMRVTNGHKFSYPGYSEMLVGFADPRIDSNDKKPNPNVTVLEWLNGRPRFHGRVAAFATWDTVAFILNRERCGFYINAGLEPVTEGPVSPSTALLNQLKRDIPPRWEGGPFDALTFYSALEYLKEHKPKVLYITFGETDEWGHEGRYAEYLDAARRTDGFLRTLWETVQSLPEYRDKTTLLIVNDHGRGHGPEEWKNHGAKIDGAENVWFAMLGPNTPALGERTSTEPLTLAQVAATLAAALGEDYCGAVPQAARPIVDAVGVGAK
jgi:hypothetical protein